MDEAPLIERQVGPIAELILNRPRARNALDAELVQRLGAALARVARDTAIRVIVLGGAGGAFCSGVDLHSAQADLPDRERLGERLRGFHSLIETICSADKPVIAAIDGPAVGFGADLAFACDLRLASERAYFESKFVALGLMPDGGGTYHLPRLIGFGKAMERLLLGSRIDASTALSDGIVSRVVAADALTHEVHSLAVALAAGPPLALAAIKHAVRANASGTLEQALTREFAGQLALLGSADVQEGLAAFFARRKPEFQGR